MKTFSKIFLLLVLLLPVGAFAQVGFSIGANGGLTTPTADLATDFNSGYNIGGEAELSVLGNTFYGDVVYNSMSPKNTVLNVKNLNITEISVGYRRDLFSLGALAGGSAVFVDAGIGMYSTSEYFKTGSFIATPSASNFGLSGGLGASFHFTPLVKFVGKFKYHNIIDAANGNKTYFNIGAGINIGLK